MSIVVFFGARASFWPRSYSTDGTIADEEHDEVWQVSKARLQYWPRLYERHIHQVQPRVGMGLISSRAFVWPNALVNCKVTDFGSEKSQSFSEAPDAVQLGDPMNNIFIINLPLGLACLCT